MLGFIRHYALILSIVHDIGVLAEIQITIWSFGIILGDI